MENVKLKANLLSHGIAITAAVLNNYGYPFLEKRRAYGSPDPFDMRNRTLPQELYILPEKLIVAVNVNHDSKWKLTYKNGKYYVTDECNYLNEVTFPKRPDFYDKTLSTGEKISQIITLYGGSALGFFVNENCAMVDIGKACKFCSIHQNRSKGTDFVKIIKEEYINESLQTALHDSKVNITQVMINGGTFKDFDKNFSYYSRLTKLASQIIHQSKKRVNLHLIVFPPTDMSLLGYFKDTNAGIIINTEVFDPVLFKEYCPGKEIVLGRNKILDSLEKAAMVLGKGRVYSVIVGGLEPIESLYDGLVYLAERNVTPIINLLHTDPETPLENFKNPSVEFIMEMGQALQEVYEKYHLRAGYLDCGRNSIDTEAYRGLFRT